MKRKMPDFVIEMSNFLSASYEETLSIGLV